MVSPTASIIDIQEFQKAIDAYNQASQEFKFLARVSEYGGGKIDAQAYITALNKIAIKQQHVLSGLIEAIRPLTRQEIVA